MPPLSPDLFARLPEPAALDRLALTDKARAHFGLRPDLPVLLVTHDEADAAAAGGPVVRIGD